MIVESPLDCKEIKPVYPKGKKSRIFTGRTEVEAETLILWPPDAKSWLIWKDPDVGKDWRQEEKGTTEDKMVGWHHRLNGHEFGWVPGVGDGQGGLACYSPWGLKESDTTEWLKWTEAKMWWTLLHAVRYIVGNTPLTCLLHCLGTFNEKTFFLRSDVWKLRHLCHLFFFLWNTKRKCPLSLWEHVFSMLNAASSGKLNRF